MMCRESHQKCSLYSLRSRQNHDQVRLLLSSLPLSGSSQQISCCDKFVLLQRLAVSHTQVFITAEMERLPDPCNLLFFYRLSDNTIGSVSYTTVIVFCSNDVTKKWGTGWCVWTERGKEPSALGVTKASNIANWPSSSRSMVFDSRAGSVTWDVWCADFLITTRISSTEERRIRKWRSLKLSVEKSAVIEETHGWP